MNTKSSPKSSNATPATSSVITVGEARKRCETTVSAAFKDKAPILVDALPAMGKSRSVVAFAAKFGRPLTVLTERHDLYDQYAEWCAEEGITYKRLPSFHNDCPTAAGEYGAKWRNRVLDLYRAGLSGSSIHHETVRLVGSKLPCQSGSGCPYHESLDFDPNDYDVLIGNYKHSYSPRYVKERYVVFDEFPGESLLTEFKADQVSTAVTHFLQRHDGLPFSTYFDLLEDRQITEVGRKARAWFESRRENWSTPEEVLEERYGDTHALAPLLTFATLVAERLGNNWEHSAINEKYAVCRDRSTGTVTVLQRPELARAKSIVALDGTPVVETWRLLLGSELVQRSVLTEREQAEYLQAGLGLDIIQTTDEQKPYAGGEWVTLPTDRAILSAIQRQEGRRPVLISSKSAIGQYEKGEALEYVDDYTHFYNVRGTNNFKAVRLGVVMGSPEKGEGIIKKWGALAGLSVEWNGEHGMARSYGPFGDAVLHGMREAEVLQSVMRFGRTEKDGERGAKVYVHTAALPDWVPRRKQFVDVHLWDNGQDKNDGLAQVLAAIGDRKEWRTPDIYNDPNVTVSDVTVLRVLKRLQKYGYVEKEDEGPGVGYRWRDVCLSDVDLNGHVEFGEELPTGSI